MPRNARLALVEQDRELADGQLHPAQKRENRSRVGSARACNRSASGNASIGNVI